MDNITYTLRKRLWRLIISQLRADGDRVTAQLLDDRLGSGDDNSACQISIEPGARFEVIREAAAKRGIKLELND